MSSVVTKFDYGRNFWEHNPMFKAVEPFKSLYINDGTKHKEKSSLWMWAVSLCYDFDSQYFGLEESQRREMVGEDVIGDKEFFDKQPKELLEAYQTVTDTSARRQLRVWNKKLDEKSFFMKELKYDAKNWKMIDEMLKTNKELYDSYFKIEKMIANESAGDQIEGQGEESLMEKGLLKENELGK